MDLFKFFRLFQPVMHDAGQYALRIQHHVNSLANKDNENNSSFQQAITDADVSIQTMFEIKMLEHYPKVHFKPEEIESSLNYKYFPKDSDTLVLLDPINATTLYKHNYDNFDIVLTVLINNEMLGAMTFLPAKDVFFIGIKGNAFVCLGEAHGYKWIPWKINIEKVNRILIHNCPEDIENKLRKNFNVIDFLKDFPHSTQFHPQINSVLVDHADAYVNYQSKAMDWGAIGYITKCAGGLFTTADGDPEIPDYSKFPKERIPHIVVAKNRIIHQKIIDVINS